MSDEQTTTTVDPVTETAEAAPTQKTEDEILSELLDAEDEPDSQADEPAESEADTQEESVPDADEAEYQSAMKTLSRWKVPDSVLKGMDKAHVIAWASEAKGMQSETDRLGREHAELRKRFEELDTAKQDSAQADEPSTLPVDELVKAAVDEFGESHAFVGALRKFAQAIGTQDKSSQWQERFDNIERQNQILFQIEERRALRTARESLLDDYPKLKNSDEFGSISKRAAALIHADPERYDVNEDGVQKAMADACILVYGKQSQIESINKLKTEARNRRASQASSASATREPAKKLSRSEAEDKVLDMIENGASESEVKAFAREHGV